MNEINKSLIFLVEDNETYALMLDYKLKNLGNYNLKSFSTAQACIDNLYQKPKVIIMDYFLPEMNGMEALKIIKSKNKDIPVIFLSGQNDIQVALDAVNNGAMCYVLKNKEAIDRIFENICIALINKQHKADYYSFSINASKDVANVVLFLLVIIIVFGALIYIMNSA